MVDRTDEMDFQLNESDSIYVLGSTGPTQISCR